MAQRKSDRPRPLIIAHSLRKVKKKPLFRSKSVKNSPSRPKIPQSPTKSASRPKIALVCDWLTDVGGAERVLKELSDLYPDAPIYTSQYRPTRIDWFRNRTVRTGWLNFFPRFLRRFLGPLRQLYFSHLDLTDYDLVISVTGAEAKSVKARRHLCYCHVPTQYYWQLYDQYLENPGFGWLNPLARLGLRLLVRPLRSADFRFSARPDQFITISDYSAAAIRKYYQRDSIIIAPPVNVSAFASALKSSQPAALQPAVADSARPLHFINFSRQVNWKRLDLAIKACLKTGSRLTLIGSGPEHNALVRLAAGSPLINFLPTLPQTELKRHLASADAFLFPSLEPFGIAPVEALSAGCPVIAYGDGGARDYILPGENGLTFPRQTVDSLVKAIRSFRPTDFSPAKVSASAAGFSVTRFRREISSVVKTALASTPSKPAVAKSFRTSFNLFLLTILPALLYLSYHPNFHLSSLASMNLEFSLPLIWLVVFVGFNLPSLTNFARPLLTKITIRDTIIVMGLLAPFFSLFWTHHLLRGVLTAGILGLIYLAIVSFILLARSFRADLSTLRPRLSRAFWLSAELIAIFCLVQCFADALGLNSDFTLMCRGCLSTAFGFPRATGFAIEPQFMGNLLLAPALLALFLLLRPTLQEVSFSRQLSSPVALRLILFTLVIFLTLSRGAIYAYIIGIFIMLAIFTLQSWRVVAFTKLLRTAFLSVLPLIFGGILSLLSIGALAEIGPTNLSFTDAIANAIHQLSLGRIDFRSSAAPSPSRTEISADSQSIQAESPSPSFSGYVAESTDTRLKFSRAALRTWGGSFQTILFGVGLGGTGRAMFALEPTLGTAKEIVQNQYLELLLEFGAVGTVLLFASLALLVYRFRFQLRPHLSWLLPLGASYVFSLLFFSGLPNALHIYLLPFWLLLFLPGISSENTDPISSGRRQK